LKSPTASQFAPVSAEGVDFVVKVPSPLPRRIDTVPLTLLATAMSEMPSPLKSAVSKPRGLVPTFTIEVGIEGNIVDTSAAATGTRITFDFPPPGPGLNTDTDPPPTAATNESGTEEVSSLELTKVVESDVLFQTIREVETNPVPFTVSVTAVDPGFMLIGDASSMNGTGLLAAQALGIEKAPNRIAAQEMSKHGFKHRAIILGRARRLVECMDGAPSCVSYDAFQHP